MNTANKETALRIEEELKMTYMTAEKLKVVVRGQVRFSLPGRLNIKGFRKGLT